MSFNYMCQMLAHQYIFKPPKRSPLANYHKSANERFVRSIDGDAKVRGVVAWHQRCGVSRDEAERGRAKREGNGSTERGWLAGLLALCALFQARKPKR